MADGLEECVQVLGVERVLVIDEMDIAAHRVAEGGVQVPDKLGSEPV